MPCRDYEENYTVSQTDYDRIEADRDRIKKRLDLATRVACELEKAVADDNLCQLSEETQTWVKEHRAADVKRKKQEAEQAQREREEKERQAKLKKDRLAALKKLTRDERRVLGLPDPA